jgi:hypothetical protein
MDVNPWYHATKTKQETLEVAEMSFMMLLSGMTRREKTSTEEIRAS